MKLSLDLGWETVMITLSPDSSKNISALGDSAADLSSLQTRADEAGAALTVAVDQVQLVPYEPLREKLRISENAKFRAEISGSSKN
jgi:hypothetical protein